MNAILKIVFLTLMPVHMSTEVTALLTFNNLWLDYILYMQAPWRIYSINWWGWVSFMLMQGYILPKDLKYLDKSLFSLSTRKR